MVDGCNDLLMSGSCDGVRQEHEEQHLKDDLGEKRNRRSVSFRCPNVVVTCRREKEKPICSCGYLRLVNLVPADHLSTVNSRKGLHLAI